MHISALIFSYTRNLAPIAKRLATQPFDVVAQSLPLNYAKDVGWFTPRQLAGTQYAPAAALPAGGTAPMNHELSPGFVHVDQIIPQMSCDHAIAIRPTEAWPRLARATLEMQSRAYAAASADYRVAAQSTNRQFALAAQYGLASVQYTEQHYAKALRSVNLAIESNTGEAYTLRALIEEAMGNDDLATADAQQGVNQYNGNDEDASPATYALARAYSDLGYFAASDDQLGALLKRHPHDAQALVLRGFNEFSTGHLKHAGRDFAAALNANPPLEQAYLGLAMSDYSSGNRALARRFARRALTLFPGDEYVKLWFLITAGRAPLRPKHLQPCEGGFYAGIYALQHGRTRQAHKLFRAAARKCPYREYERATALQLLKR